MSVSAAQLVAEVTVNGVEAAKSKLESMGQAVEHVSSGFKSMLGNALSFAAGQAIFNLAGDALGFLKDQFAGCLQESMDAEQEMAQTVKVLQSTHDASGMTADAIANLAAQFSHLTEFTDDQIQVGENLLLTFTNIGKKTFPEATQAMLDMSQAMGQDTKTSAIQLGKALNDPLTGMSALQRVGVTFTQSQKDLIKQMMATGDVAGAQGVILKELQREFGGSAVAAGKTFPGQLKILSQSFDDIKQKIGDAVLPMLKQFVGVIQQNVVPAVDRFADWFTKVGLPALQRFAGWIGANVIPVLQRFGAIFGQVTTALKSPEFAQLAGTLNQIFAPALQRVSALLTGVFKPALASLSSSNISNISTGLRQAATSINDFLKALAGFQSGTSGFAQAGGVIRTIALQVWSVLQQVGSFLAATFIPVWQQLAQSWGEVQKALQPIMPELRFLAQIIGGVLVASLGIVIAILAGVVKAFAGLLIGVARTVTGVIQFFSGLVQFFSGIFQLIYDIFSGNWGKIASDLNKVMQGIMNMFIGVWNTITGIFSIAFGVINGFASGFVNAIIGFFQYLANVIVGHSIIPDMINGIINWFTQLPGRVGAFVVTMVTFVINYFNMLYNAAVLKAQALVNTVVNFFAQLPGRALGAIRSLTSNLVGFFSGLAGQAVQWGANIIQGLINGIASMAGNVTNAIGNIVGIIASHLPHSPAKEGELKHLNEYGPALVRGFSEGITKSAPMLKAAITHLVQPAAALHTPASFSGGTSLQFPSIATGTGQTIIINPPPIYLDGKLMAKGLAPHLTNQIRWTTGAKV